MTDYIDNTQKRFKTKAERLYNHANDSEYLRLRDEANKHRVKSEQLSQKSQSAHNSGDEKLAEELLEQSEKVMDQSISFNNQAADYVFRENNEGKRGDEIDLHGLYVREAIWFLQRRISREVGMGPLRVITGTGSHSPFGISKLMPAVEDLCEEMGWQYRITKTNAVLIELEWVNPDSIPSDWYDDQNEPENIESDHIDQIELEDIDSKQVPNYVDRGVKLFDESTERDYNHATDSEYLRLRAEADQLYKKRNQLSQQSQAAYKSGDGKRAHELSEQSKQIMNQADSVNRQAAEYVFRENNEDSGPDEIDLHGLYVKEATWFLQQRISHDIRINQSHLRVIVGKGLHSANGIAKLKPAVNDLCKEMGLKHHIDPKNSGVLVVELQGSSADQIPSHWNANQAPQQAYHGTGQPQYHPQQQQYQPQYQQQQPQQQQEGGLLGLVVKLLCACLNSK
ncbi:Smr domain-containing protein [Spathaspora sp. JA1]|nr:Smr domain-containing protein [Spathaspora sp. JA1]